ncbi:MAG: hypothetical protein V9H26_17885 [Verrucomicrobiota bacterium]
MPTSIEQSDLNIACFGSHGDAPRVVIAPADVEDCFYTAIEAVNIARKYSVPVVHYHRPGDRHAHRSLRANPIWRRFARTSGRTSSPWRSTSPTICPNPTGSRSICHPAPALAAGNTPSSPASNTTNSGIPPVRRNCTCR